MSVVQNEIANDINRKSIACVESVPGRGIVSAFWLRVNWNESKKIDEAGGWRFPPICAVRPETRWEFFVWERWLCTVENRKVSRCFRVNLKLTNKKTWLLPPTIDKSGFFSIDAFFERAQAIAIAICLLKRQIVWHQWQVWRGSRTNE